MPSLVVFGASGFVGGAVVKRAIGWSIKAVSRRMVAPKADVTNVRWCHAEMTSPESILSVLEPGDVVLNAAFDSTDRSRNTVMIESLLDACLRANVARLIHCSTAIVVGKSQESTVTEETRCVPASPYERIKWELECRIASIATGRLDFGIIRPTVIFGVGGRNLASQIESLQKRDHVRNYLRASLFGHRKMHLVPVSHVAEALLFLAGHPDALRGNVYLVSADDESGNDYRSIDRNLRRSLGLPRRRMPTLPIPSQVLRVALALRGRTDTTINRVFQPTKLRSMGFVATQSVESALDDLGHSLRGP